MTPPITISADVAPRILDWLTHRSGVHVWQNVDLCSSSVGSTAMTPADIAQSPHWRYGNKPVLTLTKADDFVVATYEEYARVRVRRGPPMYQGINSADYYKLMDKLSEAGDDAIWEPNYDDIKGAWFTAVVSRPKTSISLASYPIPTPILTANSLESNGNTVETGS